MKEVVYCFLHRRYPCRAANQKDLVDIGGLETRILHCPFRGTHGLFDEIAGHLVEGGSCEIVVYMLCLAVNLGNERYVDVGPGYAGKLYLCLFRGIFQPLQRRCVFPQVETVILVELLRHPVDDLLVEVVPSKQVVSAGRLHLENAVAYLKYGDIEGPAPEIEYQYSHVIRLVKPVG